MSNNSNQTGPLLLLAIVLGAAVYAIMFFGSEMEQKNMSASFGQLSTRKSVNIIADNKKEVASVFPKTDIHLDGSGIAMPSYKMKRTSGGDYTQSSNVDFPTTGVEQANVPNLNESTSATRTSSTGNYTHNQSQSFAFGYSDVQYISNPQNPTKSDINALLLLDTRAAEVAISTQQGSKRSTPALKGKTASASVILSDNKLPRKIDGGGSPGDPGASLPIGDGVLSLLLFAAVYSIPVSKSRLKIEASKRNTN